MARAATVDDTEIFTGVCIVGAGPAGLTLAKEFDEHGVKACLLESGGLDIEPEVQGQSTGESDGYPINRLDRSRVRAYGGTLRHPRIQGDAWAARPLDPIDFERNPTDARSIGWPFDSTSLNAYYSRAVRTCGIRDHEEASSWWYDHASPEAVRVAEGKLSPAVFQFSTKSFRDSWSILSTSASVQVLLHTRAVQFNVDPVSGRVDRIVAVRGDRSRVVIRARVVVFAAGGIENARMLLMANDGRGLGNEHDLVGRYFAERLSFHAGEVVLTGNTTLNDFALFHRPPGLAIGGGLRLADHVQRDRQLPNCAFFMMPRPLSIHQDGIRSLSTLRKAWGRRPLVGDVGQHLRNVLTAGPPLADLALGKVASRPQGLALRAQGEQAPNRESRVRLGAGRDDLGMPVARVTWRMTDDDFAAIRACGNRIDEVLQARGVGYLRWAAELDGTTLIEGNNHHLGATRMHPDPASGVVDADCRVHSVPNLYVAGCSVFPRYGASNPTLTIIALAHRLADHLRMAAESDLYPT